MELTNEDSIRKKRSKDITEKESIKKILIDLVKLNDDYCLNIILQPDGNQYN